MNSVFIVGQQSQLPTLLLCGLGSSGTVAEDRNSFPDNNCRATPLATAEPLPHSCAETEHTLGLGTRRHITFFSFVADFGNHCAFSERGVVLKLVTCPAHIARPQPVLEQQYAAADSMEPTIRHKYPGLVWWCRPGGSGQRSGAGAMAWLAPNIWAGCGWDKPVWIFRNLANKQEAPFQNVGGIIEEEAATKEQQVNLTTSSKGKCSGDVEHRAKIRM